MTKKEIDALTYQIIGAAIDVHKEIGPGLLESVYHECLIHELNERNMALESELHVPLRYKGKDLKTNLKCDLVVQDSVLVELKVIDIVMPVHQAQLLTYMRLLKKPKGILINFNCTHIFKEGQQTFVNEHYRRLKAS